MNTMALKPTHQSFCSQLLSYYGVVLIKSWGRGNPSVWSGRIRCGLVESGAVNSQTRPPLQFLSLSFLSLISITWMA